MSREKSMRPNGAKSAARTDRSFGRLWVLLAVCLLLCGLVAGCSGKPRGDKGSTSSSNHSRVSGDSAADWSSGPSSGGSSGGASSGSSSSGGSSGGGSSAEGTFGRASRAAGNTQAAPGQLTAGEWRDVDRWDDWLKLIGSYEGTENRDYWGYFRFDRLVVRAEADGQPIADADVIVKDANGRVVWRSKTDVDGYAWAYARMFEQDDRGQQEEGYSRARPGYDVEVRAGGESRTFSHVQLPREEPLVVAFEQRPVPSNAIDLMFVVDTTGSMQDEIDFLREELKDVITRARQGAGQLDVEVSVVFYRDRYDDYVVKGHPFTSDIDTVVRHIAREKAEGGGDYPEAVEQALTHAVSGTEWRRSARTRLLFLVGDAPPRNEPQIVDELHDATLEAAKLGIRIVPVASSGVDVNTEYLMRFLAAATGGTYVFLTDHSGIGNDHLEAAVGEFEVRPLNDLLVEIIRRYAGLPEEN